MEVEPACYVPSEDKIYLPNYENFKITDDYYATRLHETGHSTGAEKRLNRDTHWWLWW
jgi:antirestriction protein ArdC